MISQVEQGARLVNIEAINSYFTAIVAKFETPKNEGRTLAKRALGSAEA